MLKLVSAALRGSQMLRFCCFLFAPAVISHLHFRFFKNVLSSKVWSRLWAPLAIPSCQYSLCKLALLTVSVFPAFGAGLHATPCVTPIRVHSGNPSPHSCLSLRRRLLSKFCPALTCKENFKSKPFSLASLPFWFWFAVSFFWGYNIPVLEAIALVRVTNAPQGRWSVAAWLRLLSLVTITNIPPLN